MPILHFLLKNRPHLFINAKLRKPCGQAAWKAMSLKKVYAWLAVTPPRLRGCIRRLKVCLAGKAPAVRLFRSTKKPSPRLARNKAQMRLFPNNPRLPTPPRWTICCAAKIITAWPSAMPARSFGRKRMIAQRRRLPRASSRKCSRRRMTNKKAPKFSTYWNKWAKVVRCKKLRPNFLPIPVFTS